MKYISGVEGSFGWITSKIQTTLDRSRGGLIIPGRHDWVFVKDVYLDVVVVENEDEGNHYEASWEIDDGGVVTFGGFQEVTLDYVKKTREGAAQANTTNIEARFVRKDKARQIAYGYAMIPGIPDSDGDIVTEDKIEEVAHKFIKKGYHDLMHEVGDPAAELVESWIEQEDKTLKFLNSEDDMVIPKGSWGIAVKVHDDVWPGVEDGTYKGFSIMAVLEEQKESVKSASDIKAAMKRVTLKDLEKEGTWGVDSVSIVDDPAVGMALFFATKSKPQEEEEQGFFSRMFGKKYAPGQSRYPKKHPKGGHFCDSDDPKCGSGSSESKESESKESEGTKSYTIKDGDTLSELAERFGTTVEALVELNGIEDPDLIIAGETLKIPKEGESEESGGSGGGITKAGEKTLKGNLKQFGLSKYLSAMKKATEKMMSDDPDWANDFFADVPQHKKGEAKMSVAAALEKMDFEVEYKTYEDGSTTPIGNPKRPEALKINTSNKNMVFISNKTKPTKEGETIMPAEDKSAEGLTMDMDELALAMATATKTALIDSGLVEAPKTEAEKAMDKKDSEIERLKKIIAGLQDKKGKKNKKSADVEGDVEEEDVEEEEEDEVADAEEDEEEDETYKSALKAIKRLEKRVASMKKGSSKSLLSDEDEDDKDEDEFASEGRNAQGIRIAPMKEVS